MNSKLKLCALLASLAIGATLCGCAPADNSGSNGGAGNNSGQTENNGNGSGGDTQTVEINSELNGNAEKVINSVKGATEIPKGATAVTGKITIEKAGNYYVNSEITGKKITIDCAGVTLYLSNAKLSNEKKVIESNYPLTITLLGKNEISNSNPDGSNAVDCAGDLTVNGSGSLKITSTKNGIKANSVSVTEASLEIISANDGIHAETDKYDAATSAPSPSYDDGGYVCLDGATVKIDATADGIQADTFVYISRSNVNIKAGGGAPNAVTGNSSSSASGKGIKAGAIDWGTAKTDLDWEGGLITLKSGEININSDDDAIHSKGEVDIYGGKLTIATGDDAIHADITVNIGGGTIDITKSYEGIEATNVNVLSGEISLIAADDGINAGGGADQSGFGGNDFGHGWGPARPRAAANPAGGASSCITVAGGKITVDAAGDGLDSNGDIVVSGGELYVNGSTDNANAAIDYDNSARITGGTVVAAGAGGMAQNFGSASTQGSILYKLSSQSSGAVTLTDGEGNGLISFTPSKKYSTVVVSCPAIVKGGTYTLTAGGKTATITMSGLIYGNGPSMGR